MGGNESEGNEREIMNEEHCALDEELHLELQKVNLDVEKWAVRLKRDVGIETIRALK